MVGQTISHYRVVRRVGGGGMGEVYEAQDLNLGRRVALKFIAPTRSHTPQAIQRFEREARAASALNHPHICTIHDVGDHDGERFIVMELLEGASVRERLRSGPLLAGESVDVAEQAADALAAAHRAGIVHRDVTPGNIFITSQGQVKLVDFGLAKLEPHVPQAGAIAADLSTETADEELLTSPGAMAGTVAYMSPEQVRGDGLDHRSDLFSLGTVLYEMVTGRRPFTGRTSALVFDAILHAAVQPLPREVVSAAPNLQQVIDKALEKDPRLRYQSALEMKIDLARLRRTSDMAIPVYRPPARVRRWPLLTLGAVAILSAAGTATYFLQRNGDSGLPTAVPRQVTTGAGIETEPAISPDGSTIAFTSNEAGNQDIWIVDVHGGPPQRLTTGPSNDSHPSWFPDGSAIAFASDRGGRTSTWRTPRMDGEAATLLVPDADTPAVSPDGAHIAFVRAVNNQYTRVAVAAVADPSHVRVLTADHDGLWDHMDPAWSRDGKLICYAAWDGLWTVLAAGGTPTHLTTQRHDGQPVWSADGRFVYFTSYQDTAATLWRVPAAGGARERVTLGSGVERRPFVSRDGHLLAFSTESDDRDLVRIDVATGAEVRFGSSSREDFPVFGPDGRTVYFVSDRWGTPDVWNQAISEEGVPGTPHRVFEQDGLKSQPECSPDGRWITYYRVEGNRRDVWIVSTTGGTPARITDDPTGAVHPVWSPDGTKIAFVSDRSGRQQIWVQRVINGKRLGDAVPVTWQGRLYRFPAWSPDASQIAFVSEGPTGKAEAVVMRSDGRGPVSVITSGAGAVRVRWIRRSGLLLVSGLWGGTRYEIRTFDRDGNRVRGQSLLIGPDPIAGVFDVSPDGRFIITARGKPGGDVWVMQSQSRSF